MAVANSDSHVSKNKMLLIDMSGFMIVNVMQSNSYLPTTMRWSKAKMRGQSGNGEEINKMMNQLLYLLVLLHPRDVVQEKQGVTFKTSLERKLNERSRESKKSLVSEQKKRHICTLETATALIPQIRISHI